MNLTCKENFSRVLKHKVFKNHILYRKMKKSLIILLFTVLIFFHLSVFIAFEWQRSITGFFFSKFLTASPSIVQSFGEVALSVLGKFILIVYSPQPITYLTQSIDLNVSADTAISDWRFTLQRLNGTCSGQIIYDRAGFLPNITISGVRNSNLLTVFAQSTLGELENASVVFYISVPNQAPKIQIQENILLCEGKEYSSFFSVIDENLDCIAAGINQSPPFYVFVHQQNLNLTQIELFSGILKKSDVGIHQPEISASDGESVDIRVMNVSIFPINNAPVLVALPLKTFETYHNLNSSFYAEIQANDLEDGNSSSGNLSFNSTFTIGRTLFTVNESLGIINFSYNISDIGAYKARICVQDLGLNSSSSTQYCNESGERKASCFNWEFVVTYVNRRPNITFYGNSKTGTNLSLELTVGELVVFNLSAFDPDGNTPSLEWYFDNEFRRSNLSNYDEFFFIPTLEEVGEHKLFGVATDFLLNDSIVWNITIVGSVSPLVSGGGGGGSGAKGKCLEKWGCSEWSACQHDNEIEVIKNTCTLFNISEENCGIQLRRCVDIGGCNSSTKKPKELQMCYFTLHPSCNDGILNCHDGGCELLVDCGGPCDRCPTCSDGKMNQFESGVDCGGVCPACLEVPFFDIRKRLGITVNLFIFLAVLLILFILYEALRIRRLRYAYGKKIRKIVGESTKT